MRVCFVGAGGTGKTSTMNALADMCTLNVVPSVSRMVHARHTKAGMAAGEDYTGWSPEQRIALQKDIAETQWTTFQNRTNILSDRSPIDHLAYYLTYCGDHLDESQVNEAIQATRTRVVTFTHLMYFPLTSYGEGAVDGFRKNGYGYRYAFDALIRSLLKDMYSTHYTVKAVGTPVERATRILAVLNQQDPSIIKKV